MNDAVGVGGLEVGAAEHVDLAVLVFLTGVDEHPHDLADALGRARKAEGLGDVHHALLAVVLDLLIHLVGHLGGLGAVLLRVGKDRAVVELGLLDEVDQLVELLGRLAREAHERGGAQGDSRHLAA